MISSDKAGVQFPDSEFLLLLPCLSNDTVEACCNDLRYSDNLGIAMPLAITISFYTKITINRDAHQYRYFAQFLSVMIVIY